MQIAERIPEPVRRFWRERITPRPIASGSIAAVAAGLVVGGFLAAGEGFEPPPPMQPARIARSAVQPTPQPIALMKGPDGKVPDYVIGTDNIPGAQTWRDRLPVQTLPDDEDLAQQAQPRRGLGWFLSPWRWGRDPEPAPAPRPSRRIESGRRVMDREAVVAQYERDRARYERDRRRWEQQYAEAEIEREDRRAPRYDPRYDPRDEPRSGPPAYDPRDARDYDPEEEAPYAYRQAAPPPERWRYSR